MSGQQSRHERSEIILSLFSAAEREVLLRDREAVDALGALASYSPALTQALAARVELARWLFLERSFEKIALPRLMAPELAAALRGAITLEEVQAGLRAFRLRELTRLAVRDLTGRADLDEVTQTLSALAGACLNEALDFAVRQTAERYGLTPRGLGVSPVILGMGKLGAEELNYSSDVDLIYLFRAAPAQPGAPAAETAADLIFTTVTRAMSEVTENGLVFRVDLDLRPGGKDGPQAQSLEKALKHYLLLGQAWERLALLKARPVAGDLAAGEDFLAELLPFIYRRHLDYTSLEELKDLKTRFAREARARVRRSSGHGGRPPLNVKLSPGGIREVEFFAQALTLTFGGRLPHLRIPTTVGALGALAGEGIITESDAEVLTQAYVFLRTVEHRLQLREMTQTQSLPKSPETRDSLGRSMGFQGEAYNFFAARLEKHMSQVNQRYRKLLAEPEDKERGPDAGRAQVRETGPPDWVHRLLDDLADEENARAVLTEAGFRRPEAALAACRTIREEKFLPNPLSRYGRNLERLLPKLIAGAAATPDPDRAILHLERFLVSIGPKAGFFVLLEENPQLIELMSLVFGYSDFLSDILIKHPAILDSLIDRRSALPFKDHKQMISELDTMLGLDDDPEACLSVIRRFKNDETLRVGVYDLSGRLSLTRIQAQLTSLAEVVLTRTLDLTARMLAPQKKTGQSLALAVLGLGKLGGRELAYGSDLDLIFLLGRGKNAVNLTVEEAVRLTQRLISYLSVSMDAGPGYEIDSRLRPSGRSGPLVVTAESFAKYHETSQLWERQALLKMRGVLGPAHLLKKVRSLALRTVFENELDPDAARKIDDLRQRMTRERARLKPGTINLKFSPGGLVDVEFLTQFLQLKNGRRQVGGVRSTGTGPALRSLARLGRGGSGLPEAAEDYELISRLSMRLGLIYARSGDRAAYTPEEIASAHLPDISPDPLAELEAAMGRTAATYDRVFGRK